MINYRSQPTPISGYYEYLSQFRHRVNVTPHEDDNNEETIAQTTKTTTAATSPAVAAVMDNYDNISATNSLVLDYSQQLPSNLYDNDVTNWSSTDVQRWIEEQCQKFELKRATIEKFQMNGMIHHIVTKYSPFYLGQGLVLLTKHDFIRRSPDGGEILYYALQRLISKFFFSYLIM
jgi:hypothetical protein